MLAFSHKLKMFKFQALYTTSVMAMMWVCSDTVCVCVCEDRLQVFASVVSSTYDSKQLSQAFDELGDGSGLISMEVLRDVLINLGDKLRPGDVNAMIGECDDIVEGQVDYLESHQPSGRRWFREIPFPTPFFPFGPPLGLDGGGAGS